MNQSTHKPTRGRDPLTPEARALFSEGPVVEIHGRWYITAGNPGFNSRMNNGRGWSYRRTAEIAIAHFAEQAAKARAEQ